MGAGARSLAHPPFVEKGGRGGSEKEHEVFRPSQPEHGHFQIPLDPPFPKGEADAPSAAISYLGGFDVLSR